MGWEREALEKTLKKVSDNIEKIGFSYPHVSLEGAYNDEGPGFWTSGFWPGLLWLLYQETGEKKAKELAVRLEEGMDGVLDYFLTLHHDVGFMWLPSAVAHYREDGNETSRQRGLKAASHLAGRFNLAGRFLRAWNDEIEAGSQGWSIIDSMMNLPLLYWASGELDDPRFFHIAKAHTDTVLRAFLRPDSTVPHIVRFDPVTGEKLENLGGQGKGPDSAWSRGQSWALYGLAIAGRETGGQIYKDAAKNIANFVLSHLPEDKVPWWDYKAEKEERSARDSSAAACAASGLLELAGVLEEESDREFFREQAAAILKGLYENWADFSGSEQGILRQGTVSYPAGRHVNVPIIYGDYFFLEALIKLQSPLKVF